MTETPPALPPGPSGPQGPSMSLMARLLNVFATPGEVFDDIKAAKPSTASWLVPALLTAVVMALTTIIVMSQPAIQQKMREQQEQMIEKQVQAGRISRADAEKQLAIMEKFSGPTMKAVSGVLTGIIYGFVRVFWWATVLWLLGRWLLKVPFPYLKSMEAAGLAGMIGVLGMIVTLLLQVNLSDLNSSPSLALLVKEFDPKKTSHLLLGAVNVFHIWQAAILAMALSRLAAVPFVRGALTFLPFWFLFVFVMLIITAGVSRLMG